MLTRIAFVVAVVLALLSLGLPGQAGVGVMAIAAVCLAALLAAIEAGRAGRFLWVASLLVLAAVLNPILPLALSPTAAVLLLSVSLAMLTSWMAVLHRTVPSQSIAQVLHPQDPR
jgi:hypothetical protein